MHALSERGCSYDVRSNVLEDGEMTPDAELAAQRRLQVAGDRAAPAPFRSQCQGLSSWHMDAGSPCGRHRRVRGRSPERDVPPLPRGRGPHRRRARARSRADHLGRRRPSARDPRRIAARGRRREVRRALRPRRARAEQDDAGRGAGAVQPRHALHADHLPGRGRPGRRSSGPVADPRPLGRPVPHHRRRPRPGEEARAQPDARGALSGDRRLGGEPAARQQAGALPGAEGDRDRACAARPR